MLDIDNTLVTYDDEYPTKENLSWFSSLADRGIRVVFVSNNHTDRVEKFAKRAGLPYFADASKPSTKYYKEAMRLYSLQPSECAGVGDQIFTDCVAAHRAGIKFAMVKPIQPKESLFFRIKRFGERPFVRGLDWLAAKDVKTKLKKFKKSKPKDTE